MNLYLLLYIVMQKSYQDFDKQDKDLIIFSYKRPASQQPIEQIGIRIKPRKIVKTQIERLALYFQQMNLEAQHKQARYFLTKIITKQQTSIKKPGQQKQIIQQLYQMNLNKRNKIREDKFNQIRQRNNVKFYQLKDEDFVIFNGKKVAYENIGPSNIDYYIFQDDPNRKQPPQTVISAPKELKYMLEDNNCQIDNELNDSQDSNRQDHPDYQYPDEQDFDDNDPYQGYNRDSSDEGVISGDERSDGQVDEQQLYRRYLKRCKQTQNQEDMNQQMYQCQ